MIELLYNERRFDYDIYSLTKAFFPQEDIRQSLMEETGEKETDKEADKETGADDEYKRLQILYTDNGVSLRYLSSLTAAPLSRTVQWPESADRSRQKNSTKRLLYRLWQEVTGKNLPWGTLSGIRPVKLFVGMLEEGLTAEEIRRLATEEYLLSQGRLEKSLQIAEREISLLSKLDVSQGYSLYIGLPFCPTICLYCSFGSALYSKWVGQLDTYLAAVEKELRFIGSCMQGRHLQTVYIGGGTPTVLTAEQLERLLAMIERYFDRNDLLEMTVEAGRPDSITREKLEVLRSGGVDRISINPQTKHDDTLRLIGRHHTAQQVEEAMRLAREVGFTNINMDLIAGLPSENIGHLAETLSWVKEMLPESLTVHALAIKRASALAGNTERFRFCLREEDDVMGLVDREAAAIGLQPYYLYRQKNITGNLENIGYARAGRESLYNMLIMEEKQCIMAVGAGAITKLVRGSVVERIENVKDVKEYLGRIDEMIERKRRIVSWLNQ